MKIKFLNFIGALLFAITLNAQVYITGETSVCANVDYIYKFHVDPDDEDDYYLLNVSWDVEFAGDGVAVYVDNDEVNITWGNPVDGSSKVIATMWSYYTPDSPDDDDEDAEYHSGFNKEYNVVIRTLGEISPISGSSTVYYGDVSPKTYTIEPVAHATNYAWSYPIGWIPNTPTSGPTCTSITVTPDETHSGSICVTATNESDGCSVTDQKCLPISRIVEPPVFIAGPASVCMDDDPIETYTINHVPHNAGFEWQKTSGWTLVNILFNPYSKIVNYNDVVANPGFVKCRTISEYNPSWKSTWTTIYTKTFTDPPAQPIFTAKPGTICEGTDAVWSISPVSLTTSYTWWFVPYAGGATPTGLILTPNGINCMISGIHSGSYFIKVTANNDCGASIIRQSTIYVDNYSPECGPLRNSNNEIQIQNSLEISPNPASQMINIKLEIMEGLNKEDNEVSIKLFNSNGAIAKELTWLVTDGTNLITIDTDQLSNGIYFINIQGKTISFQDKIMITH